MMNDYIVKGIKSFPQFAEVPEDQLRAYAELSEVLHLSTR